MGRDGAQPLGLAGVATELIHVIPGERTSQGIPDFDKLDRRQCGQWQPPYWLVWEPQHEAVVVPCRSLDVSPAVRERRPLRSHL
jgi:hypothetical protein